MGTATNWKRGFEEHYLFTTTLIAIFVAAGNLSVLYYMHSDKISDGIGLAMVGVITFFGMLIVSSFFEEHRHEHASNSKKEGSQNRSTATQKMVEKVVAGKGIMRKAIASSIIIVYIIVVGLYLENGELNQPFLGVETTTSESQKSPENITKDSEGGLTDSVSFTALQLVQDEGGGSEPETEEEKQKEGEAKKPAKQIPRSLLEHFTIVVTAIVVFYFGSDIATIWFKNKYASSSTAGETPTSGAGSTKTGKRKRKTRTEANSNSE